jgi:hypothetical protein
MDANGPHGKSRRLAPLIIIIMIFRYDYSPSVRIQWFFVITRISGSSNDDSEVRFII